MQSVGAPQDHSVRSYDAIIIGSGHNGLAAAVHLASKGWSVGVFERAEQPGGAVRTEALTLPGFRHDTYAMNLSLFAGSPFLAKHKDALTRHGLAFVPAPDSFASVFPDKSWLGVSQDLETTAARIAAFSERDAAAWRAMVAAFVIDAPFVFALLGAAMPSTYSLLALWRLFRRKGANGVGDLARLLLSSPRDFLDRNFEHPSLKAMMAVWGLHLDFTPDAAGGALFPYLESMACQSFGMVIGKAGADTLVTALVGRLKELGGDLHLSSDVATVTRTRGRADGVRLGDGRRFAASRAVIANLHPKVLLDRLLPGTDHAPFRSKINAFRSGPGAMMIHYALKNLPAWSAGAELSQFAYVHLAQDFAAMALAYDQAKTGLLPTAPVLVVGQPTAIDPTRAPAGRHILWVQVRVVPAVISSDAAGEIAGTDWDSVKEAYADRIGALIERHAPGFRASILGRKVLSPLDLERDNPNLVDGDSLAGSHHLDQNFIFRPAFGWSRYKTPVKKLYIVGASTWPGAGVGAGSGYILAKMLAGA